MGSGAGVLDIGQVSLRVNLPGHHFSFITKDPLASTDQTSRIHAPWTRAVDGIENVTTWGELGRPQIHGYDMTCVAPISRLRFVSGADEKVVRVFDAPRGFARSLNALRVTADDLEAVSAAFFSERVPDCGC